MLCQNLNDYKRPLTDHKHKLAKKPQPQVGALSFFNKIRIKINKSSEVEKWRRGVRLNDIK